MKSDTRQTLQILLVEDRATDAALMVDELKQAGFDPAWRRVENEADYVAALRPTLDVILSDFNLPQFDAMRALDLLRARNLDIPFIVVSGSIGEETAVQILKRGASDYLLKDRMARLGQAVQRVMDDRRLQRAKRDAEQALSSTEARMRFALEASQVGVWETDIQTGAMQWSDIFESLHGLPSDRSSGTFQAFLERVCPDDRAAVAEAIERATRDRTDFNILYRTEWPDGSIHWISGIGRPSYDDDGRPVRAAGISFDVTDHRVLEEQYRQAQKMEAIGQLAGGVAHDFNNLLTAIQGYCSLLGDSLTAQNVDATDLADLTEIRHAAERATSLTRQLLAFSRQQLLEPRVLDLGDSLTSIAPMLQRLIGEHIDIVVRANGEPGPPGLIKADPGQMEQVILNLAVNARDAMPDGGTLTLEVATAQLDESSARHLGVSDPGPYVMLAVTDTGVGMTAATQARIFEPFFTTKETGKGTGLGLATVYGIVKQSGGYIWVSSEVGRGSRFTVCLPRVNDEADVVRVPTASASLHGSEHVLVVEDQEPVREVARRTLERLGYTVLIASTPQEALDIAGSSAPIDLVISDMVLPKMSGIALTRQLLARRPTLRVLFMSGYTEESLVQPDALGPGTPFLQKPFSPEDLARRVREVLGSAA